MEIIKLKTDIFTIQQLVEESKYNLALQNTQNLLNFLVNIKNNSNTVNLKSTARQTLLALKAKSHFHCQELDKSIDTFQKLDPSFIVSFIKQPGDIRFEKEFWNLCKDILLHSYSDAAKTAEKLKRNSLTQVYLERSIHLYTLEGLNQHMANAWYELGQLMLSTKRYTQASICLSTAANLFEKINLPFQQVDALCDIISIYAHLNEVAKINQTLEKTHLICLSLLNRPKEQKHIYSRLSTLYIQRKAYQDAGVCLKRVLSLTESGGSKATTLFKLAYSQYHCTQRDKALNTLTAAMNDCYDANSGHIIDSKLLLQIAKLFTILVDNDKAITAYTNMLKSNQLEPIECYRAYLGLAETLEATNNYTDTAYCYAQACNIMTNIYNNTGSKLLGDNLKMLCSKMTTTLQARKQNCTNKNSDSSTRCSVSIIDQLANYDANTETTYCANTAQVSRTQKLALLDFVELPKSKEQSLVHSTEIQLPTRKCNYTESNITSLNVNSTFDVIEDTALLDNYMETYAGHSHSLISVSELSDNQLTIATPMSDNQLTIATPMSDNQLTIASPLTANSAGTTSTNIFTGNLSPPKLLIPKTASKSRIKKGHSKISHRLPKNVVHPENEIPNNLGNAWKPISEGSLAFKVDSSVPKPPYIEREQFLKLKAKRGKFQNNGRANLAVNSNDENAAHSHSLNSSTFGLFNREIPHESKTNDIHTSIAPSINDINNGNISIKNTPPKEPGKKYSRWLCELL